MKEKMQQKPKNTANSGNIITCPPTDYENTPPSFVFKNGNYYQNIKGTIKYRQMEVNWERFVSDMKRAAERHREMLGKERKHAEKRDKEA